jgi:hypothetical protein
MMVKDRGEDKQEDKMEKQDRGWQSSKGVRE